MILINREQTTEREENMTHNTLNTSSQGLC